MMYKWRQIKVNKPLCNLCEGEIGEIIQIRGKPVLHHYLHELGLAVGRNISLVKEAIAPNDSSITVSAGNRITTIDVITALNIKVQVPVSLAEKEITNLTKEYARISVLRG